tara:strand:- start:1114 stop:2004 length:891 start_codon:yes stop_codon:yes gene_type:complete
MFDWDTHAGIIEMELNTMYYTADPLIKAKIMNYMVSDNGIGKLIFVDERADSGGSYRLYIYSYATDYVIIWDEFEHVHEEGKTMQLQRINWEGPPFHEDLLELMRSCYGDVTTLEEFHDLKQVWKTNYDALFDNFISAEWYNFVDKKEFSSFLREIRGPHNPSDCTLTWLKLDPNTYRDYYYCESYPKCKIIQYQELTPSDDTFTNNISDSDYEEMYKEINKIMRITADHSESLPKCKHDNIMYIETDKGSFTFDEESQSYGMERTNKESIFRCFECLKYFNSITQALRERTEAGN